ncbi:hypothetical protein [Elizabethkingia anophelis]|uniref:hypothetical protein n=1 Tax=Elizabethkingia anophelis TaxID=1117645 RepID=UPI00099AE861|nr:hypothetical protein [Elizabethkingia anophelis]OPC39218.1 hypothetical protein BAY02_09920 [Elizabethkingia anophelis]
MKNLTKLTLIILISVFSFFACTEQQKKGNSETETKIGDTEITTENEDKANDDIANEAQEWLVKNITTYFTTEELGSLDNLMQKMTTADYYAYKTDAINVDLDIDGSLTEAQFHEKWKDKFDTSKAGIHTGFLISGQDWDKIEIEKCDLISTTDKGFLFDVILKDETFQSKYPSKILVVHSGDSYKIADVIGEHSIS